jgi:hypothetical protein
MKRVDTVRAASHSKDAESALKKIYDITDDSDTGSVASENSLASAAKTLSSSASVLAMSGSTDLDDTETLTKNVQTFVDDYNSTIDALQKSNSVDALKQGLYMTNSAKAYSGALKRIGITVGSDNKLTFDEETFQSADKSAIKSVLSGNYSLSNKVADKASRISKAAGLKAQVVSYTQTGSLDYSSLLSLSSMFSSVI